MVASLLSSVVHTFKVTNNVVIRFFFTGKRKMNNETSHACLHKWIIIGEAQQTHFKDEQTTQSLISKSAYEYPSVH
jgi:hypothetical protein